QRLEHAQTIEYLDVASVGDLASLRERWQAQEQRLRTIAQGLTDGDLTSRVAYTTRLGAQLEDSAYQILFQMINHATQHRSEVALALTQLDSSPGFLDYAAFIRER